MAVDQQWHPTQQELSRLAKYSRLKYIQRISGRALQDVLGSWYEVTDRMGNYTSGWCSGDVDWY